MKAAQNEVQKLAPLFLVYRRRCRSIFAASGKGNIFIGNFFVVMHVCRILAARLSHKKCRKWKRVLKTRFHLRQECDSRAAKSVLSA